MMMTVNASPFTPMTEQGEDIHLNISENGDGFFPNSQVYSLIVYTVTALFCLCGLVGNVKVIWILGFCIKRNPFTTYMLNLAIADFGSLLSELAYAILMATANFNDIFYIFLSALDFLDFCTYSASLYLLTAISLESCLSVLLPIWHRCNRSRKPSAVISLLLWSLSILLSGMLPVCHLQGSSCWEIMNTICIVNFSICAPLMIVCSLTVLITVCRNPQRHQPRRLYIAISTALLVFIIFGIPLSMSHLIFFSSDDFPFLEASYLFTSLNSSVTPLVYYLAGRDRKHPCRESFKVVLQRLFRDDTDTGEGD